MTPSGCRHCGTPEREHGHRWRRGLVGVHRWAAPDDRQILARMKMRRALRHHEEN